MLKFTNFIRLAQSLIESKPTMPGTYVCVKPDSESIGRLHDLCMKLDLSDMVDADELHATVLYSRKHLDHDTCKDMADLPMSAIGDEFALFGHKENDKCLVLKLSSVELRGLHGLYRNMGGTHDYPTYEAHITLATGLPDSFKVPTMVPCIPITFNKIEAKALEDE